MQATKIAVPIIIFVVAVVYCGFLLHSPGCADDDPRGPTIGSVIKIKGC